MKSNQRNADGQILLVTNWPNLYLPKVELLAPCKNKEKDDFFFLNGIASTEKHYRDTPWQLRTSIDFTTNYYKNTTEMTQYNLFLKEF